MSKIDLGTTVSLNEAISMVATVGTTNSIMFQGGMGIGKSYMHRTLAERFKDTHDAVYIDMTTKDLGDLSGVPYVENHNGVKITHFAPNALLGFQSKRPTIYMFDEFGKAMRPVQNTCLRFFLERTFGDGCSAPEGSMVFGTTNKTGEGLGDMIQPHARNRISFVTVRSPNAEEWCEWAMNNNVEAEVIAWVHENPQCLASFDEGGQEDNTYIYQPNKSTTAFCTPRSLTLASNFVKNRAVLGANATIAGVAGHIGESAARAMIAYTHLADKLPSWDSIIKSPATAKVPDVKDSASCYITIYAALARVDRSSIDAWMTYCRRLELAYQGLFCISAVKGSKRDVMLNNRNFVEWATENHWLFDVK